MEDGWAEIITAIKEDRRELVLHGSEISKRIELNGLDPNIYRVVNLNFLEVSHTQLSELSEDFGKLVNLTNVILRSNQLTALPAAVGYLKKMKILDVSQNKLTTLPDEISGLADLHTLNVSLNQLTCLPDIRDMAGLHVLNISNNNLEQLSSSDVFEENHLALLQEILASDNLLTSIPAELSSFPALKVLDVSNNKLTVIPPELSQCPKLKETNFKDNKISDRRLKKLIDQCPTKAILDYLAGCLSKGDGKGKGKGKGKRQKKRSGGEEMDDLAVQVMQVLHFPSDGGYSVHATQPVADVRPYIVCCVVKDLDLEKTNGTFKMFINLQTELHDGCCQKRQAATIATHNLKAITFPVTYDARRPDHIMITPLFKNAETSARKLMDKLRQEAEAERKAKKRSQISGVHKYLDLLKGKDVYPYLKDSEDNVISLPPITNSNQTKISSETTDMFIEVTSSKSLDTCKKVMDELLQRMLELGLGRADEDQSNKLVIEQVKVVDVDGGLKVVYPSRVDLTGTTYKVVRNS